MTAPIRLITLGALALALVGPTLVFAVAARPVRAATVNVSIATTPSSPRP